MMELFFLLIVGHALADYPLQGDFLSKAKSRVNPLPGVPWYQAMGAHAVIHGGFVAFITGSTLLGIFEVIVHFVIDDLKIRGKLTFNQDQMAHVGCKVAWVLLAMLLGERYGA